MAKKKSPHKTAKPSRGNQQQQEQQRRWYQNRYLISFILLSLVVGVIYVIYLDIKITSRFQGSLWSLPSHVYARPLELFEGKQLSARAFEDELIVLGYKKVDGIPARAGQYRQWQGRHFELITREFHFWDGLQQGQSLRIDFANGQIYGLYELYSHKALSLVRLEPVRIAGIYPTQQEDRQLIKLKDVPNYLVLALLAVEDRRFYQHWGVDPRSIARALVANLSAGGTVQGGSTLTQQLVKNLFLSSERSLWRKLNEAIMAMLLEIHYDKALILETYINEVYLGQDGAKGIHGFSLASYFYFGKHLNQLSHDQIALLVGLVKGASWYDPRRHPERALNRRNQVLLQMSEQGVLTDNQYVQLKDRPLNIAEKATHSGNRYPAFVDLVKKQLHKDYDEEDLRSEGLRIFTTLDPLIQNAAENSVTTVLPQLEQSHPQAKILQTSMVVLSPENGEIQALIGDRDPDFPGYNRATDAIRQVGSLIKPGIYLAALQHPDRYHLATMLDDSPLRLQGGDGRIWEPENYDKEFKGNIPLYRALVESRNVPTVRLGMDVGLADIVQTLKKLGIERRVPPYPSMTLGAFDLSLIEVAAMYQTLAARGFNIPLRAIREVTTSEGEPLQRYPLKLEQTLDSQAVHLINYALHQVTQEGTARSLKHQLNLQVAGKTGTSDDFRDSWFAGFSDDRLAVVWVGRDDNQSTGLTGASGALRLWTHLMANIPARDLQLDMPEAVVKQWIDPETGGSTDKGCSGAVELPFLTGSGPTQRAECKSRTLMERLKGFFD